MASSLWYREPLTRTQLEYSSRAHPDPGRPEDWNNRHGEKNEQRAAEVRSQNNLLRKMDCSGIEKRGRRAQETVPQTFNRVDCERGDLWCCSNQVVRHWDGQAGPAGY